MEIMVPLIIFTTFICMSCGVLFAQGALTAKGEGARTQMLSLVISALLMVIGGIGVFFHLQHWERIFNGFGHITSGITQELIGVVLMAAVIVVFFLMVRRDGNGVAPAWCGWLAMAVSLLMVFVMAHSYMMPSIPVWNNVPYVLFFVANMLAVGAIAGALLSRMKASFKAAELCERASVAVLVVYALVIGVCVAYNTMLGDSAYAQVGYYFDPTLPDVAVVNPAAVLISVVAGENALLFWGGVVVLGVAVPLALMVLQTRRKSCPAAATGMLGAALACLVAGGVCWRVLLYIVAISAFAIF